MKSISRATGIAALAFAVAGAACASPLSFSLMGAVTANSFVMRAQEGCGELRRACLYKDVMGERGQGNCKRYRQKCGVNPDYCARLFEACVQNPKREQGCRHYRLECGSI